jgi:hypothetical protein
MASDLATTMAGWLSASVKEAAINAIHLAGLLLGLYPDLATNSSHTSTLLGLSSTPIQRLCFRRARQPEHTGLHPLQ